MTWILRISLLDGPIIGKRSKRKIKLGSFSIFLTQTKKAAFHFVIFLGLSGLFIISKDWTRMPPWSGQTFCSLCLKMTL